MCLKNKIESHINGKSQCKGKNCPDIKKGCVDTILFKDCVPKMMSDIELTDVTLQMLFRYADPLFIAVQPIVSLGKKEKSHGSALGPGTIFAQTELWRAIRTTCDMLTHYAFNAESSDELLSKLLENLRGIFLLFNVDIADKFTFLAEKAAEDIQLWYIDKYMDFDQPASTLIAELRELQFSAARNELEELQKHDVTSKVVHILGYSIYRVVATRDTGWEKAMDNVYKTPYVC